MLPIKRSPFAAADLSGESGFSSEYTAFTPVTPRAFNSLRMIRASGHSRVFSISATRNAFPSSLFPAPILEITGIPARRASSISRAFALTLSIQSATYVKSEKSKSFSVFSSKKHSFA